MKDVPEWTNRILSEDFEAVLVFLEAAPERRRSDLFADGCRKLLELFPDRDIHVTLKTGYVSVAVELDPVAYVKEQVIDTMTGFFLWIKALYGADIIDDVIFGVSLYAKACDIALGCGVKISTPMEHIRDVFSAGFERVVSEIGPLLSGGGYRRPTSG